MIVIESCAFKGCSLEFEGIGSIPIPDGTIEWYCSCGHRSRAEHDGRELFFQ